jgi:hypothetical protein
MKYPRHRRAAVLLALAVAALACAGDRVGASPAPDCKGNTTWTDCGDICAINICGEETPKDACATVCVEKCICPGTQWLDEPTSLCYDTASECPSDGSSSNSTKSNPTWAPTSQPTISNCEVTWINDGYCDRFNNKAECNFDGGDCCGDNVNKQFCPDPDVAEECSCRDPAAPTVAPSHSTTAPTAYPTALPTATPTNEPVVPGSVPSPASPTVAPSYSPTTAPSTAPTTAPPTAFPTNQPTVPSGVPSAGPTPAAPVDPTATPTSAPTVSVTITRVPDSPTEGPTESPSPMPTIGAIINQVPTGTLEPTTDAQGSTPAPTTRAEFESIVNKGLNNAGTAQCRDSLNSLHIVSLVIASVLCLMLVLTLCVLQYYRKLAVLKLSVMPALKYTMLGLLLFCVSVFPRTLATLQPVDSTDMCIASRWLQDVGYVLAVAPMILKVSVCVRASVYL